MKYILLVFILFSSLLDLKAQNLSPQDSLQILLDASDAYNVDQRFIKTKEYSGYIYDSLYSAIVDLRIGHFTPSIKDIKQVELLIKNNINREFLLKYNIPLKYEINKKLIRLYTSIYVNEDKRYMYLVIYKKSYNSHEILIKRADPPPIGMEIWWWSITIDLTNNCIEHIDLNNGDMHPFDDKNFCE